MDVVGFSELYRRYAGDVLRFALCLSRDRFLAEDLVSETFLRAWTGGADPGLPTIKSYLFAITRNLHVSRFRRQGREAALDEGLSAQLRDGGPAADERLAQQRAMDVVLDALHELGEVERMALLMRADDMPYDHIARVLGMSPEAVRVRVHRARVKLAQRREAGAVRRTS